MTDAAPSPSPDRASAERLIRREALRREAAGVASSSPTALERTLAAVSAEVTEEAADRRAREAAAIAVEDRPR